MALLSMIGSVFTQDPSCHFNHLNSIWECLGIIKRYHNTIKMSVNDSVCIVGVE